MRTTLRRTAVQLICCGAFAAAAVGAAPTAVASGCAPGFEANPFNGQCLAPVITPTINGVPCVPSKLGLCNSFVQNQQPPRVPFTSVG